MSNITEAHLKFARDVVALARAQGMNNISLEFDATSSTNWGDKQALWNPGKVKVHWTEGRHGARTRISMECTERVSLNEKGDVVEGD